MKLVQDRPQLHRWEGASAVVNHDSVFYGLYINADDVKNGVDPPHAKRVYLDADRGLKRFRIEDGFGLLKPGEVKAGSRLAPP